MSCYFNPFLLNRRHEAGKRSRSKFVWSASCTNISNKNGWLVHYIAFISASPTNAKNLVLRSSPRGMVLGWGKGRFRLWRFEAVRIYAHQRAGINTWFFFDYKIFFDRLLWCWNVFYFCLEKEWEVSKATKNKIDLLAEIKFNSLKTLNMKGHYLNIQKYYWD